MKRIIGKIINCIFFVGITFGVSAQHLDYPEIYPKLPFDFKRAVDQGFTKTTVWRGVYTKAEGDVSGSLWSNMEEFSYQYQKFDYFGSQMRLITQYFPDGFKMWSEEYFYKNNLVSATEKLTYDSLQNPMFNSSLVYLYYKDGKPFQRVEVFGFPNKNVRLLDEFIFDDQKRVVRQKTTAAGYGPGMDSLTTGLADKEVRLVINEYHDTMHVFQKFKDLHKIQEEAITVYDANGNPKHTEVTNSAGKVIHTIDYVYEAGHCVKKIHWVPNQRVESEEIAADSDPKKKKKKKKKKKLFDMSTLGDEIADIEAAVVDSSAVASDEQAAVLAIDLPQESVYKIEYFTYNDNGLIATHIIEENGIQTVFDYSHFTE